MDSEQVLQIFELFLENAQSLEVEKRITADAAFRKISDYLTVEERMWLSVARVENLEENRTEGFVELGNLIKERLASRFGS